MQKVKNWHFKMIKAFVVGDQVYAASGLKETTKKKSSPSFIPQSCSVLMFDDSRQKTVST